MCQSSESPEIIIISRDCDQNYVHVCVDCNTNIPDRTKAILENGEDPIPEMVKSAFFIKSQVAIGPMPPIIPIVFFNSVPSSSGHVSKLCIEVFEDLCKTD